MNRNQIVQGFICGSSLSQLAQLDLNLDRGKVNVYIILIISTVALLVLVLLFNKYIYTVLD